MKRLCMNSMRISATVFAIAILLVAHVFPQSQSSQSGEVGQKPMVKVYAHAFGGTGFSFLSSSDVKNVVDEDFGIGIGLPTWSYGFRAGYANIVQFEFNKGIADHNFNNNSIIPSIPSEVINMDYRTTDLQLKFNPLFFTQKINRNGAVSGWFLVVGTTEVEWLDENKDGFEGSGSIFGLEYAIIRQFISLTTSFKRYGLKFDETILFGIPFDLETNASDWILEMKFGFGLGI